MIQLYLQFVRSSYSLSNEGTRVRSVEALHLEKIDQPLFSEEFPVLIYYI